MTGRVSVRGSAQRKAGGGADGRLGPTPSPPRPPYTGSGDQPRGGRSPEPELHVRAGIDVTEELRRDERDG